MRIHVRRGLNVSLIVFFVLTIILLLPSSSLNTKLQKIVLGATWDWTSGGDTGLVGGVRLVVFGDSWVDNTVEDGEEGKGRSWTEELCDGISCTSYFNFGASQPSRSYPASPPTGAVTSNLLISSLTTYPKPEASSLLPDFAAQLEDFLSLPRAELKPVETIFVVSFGVWDVYHFAGLDYDNGKNVVNTTINEIFVQLDKLYARYTESLGSTASASFQNGTGKPPSSFRVIIPKLFDPTLLPGWLSQRAVPLKPSSVAIEQKNAVYLTELWNSVLENKIGEWLQRDLIPVKPSTNDEEKKEEDKSSEPDKIEKDIFYYDLPRYLLNLIVENYLEDQGLSNPTDFGTGDSPFASIYQPCVLDAGAGADEGYIELKGQLVCKEPEEYLFWDSFGLGGVANEVIGKEVGEMVKEGKTMRKIWEEGKPKWWQGS